MTQQSKLQLDKYDSTKGNKTYIALADGIISHCAEIFVVEDWYLNTKLKKAIENSIDDFEKIAGESFTPFSGIMRFNIEQAFKTHEEIYIKQVIRAIINLKMNQNAAVPEFG